YFAGGIGYSPVVRRLALAVRVPGKHVTHVTRERVFLVYALMVGMPVKVGVIIKNVLGRVEVKKGQSFGCGSLLTRFLRGHEIEEEEENYKPRYEPKGIDLTKTKYTEGVHGLILSFNERNARIGNMLSHLYNMQML
ncbi:hypothetical protein HAX54_051093, partial [Datura stramonium]|nr:hypothetical protein [Datura stramonium]